MAVSLITARRFAAQEAAIVMTTVIYKQLIAKTIVRLIAAAAAAMAEGQAVAAMMNVSFGRVSIVLTVNADNREKEINALMAQPVHQDLPANKTRCIGFVNTNN